MINIAHWLTLAAIGVAFPIAAAGFVRELKTVDGRPWFTSNLAWPCAISAAAIIIAGMIVQQKYRSSLVIATFVIMLSMQALFIVGYEQSPSGRAEYRPLADLIWEKYPDAEVFNAHPRGKRPPPDIGVYMNRVLRWVADPATIQPGDHPRVLLMQQDKGQPMPTPPPGWETVGSCGRSDVWWAFLLKPLPH